MKDDTVVVHIDNGQGPQARTIRMYGGPGPLTRRQMLAAWVLGTVVSSAVAACASYTAQNAHETADYTAAQSACIDKAKTRAEADACRCAVKQQFNRSCDGGAP